MITESGKKLLDILFCDDEEVSVSTDGYGYKSLPLGVLDYETIELESPNAGVGTKIVNTSEIKLVAINPIRGWRRDENVTAFRNFMVELDDGTVSEQFEYVQKMKMPYSVCVFSGGKSLHFGICLQSALPSYEIYYYYANWILNVMSRADQNTKNPSRSIRMAGAIRDGKEQKLVDIKTRITLEELNTWLSNYSGHRPKGFFKESQNQIKQRPANPIQSLPRWVIRKMENIDKSRGRNVEWFKIASEFGKAGFELEESVEIMEKYFVSEYDFKRAEWLSAVKSGLRNGKKKAGYDE